MTESVAHNLAAPVDALLHAGADGAQAAAAALVTWQGVEAALAPIVGKLGFSALYARALSLACVEHPLLRRLQAPASGASALPALHAVLLQQPVADAAAAHSSLLQTFCSVLSSLIGAALTERLLCAVSNPPSSGAPAEPSQP